MNRHARRAAKTTGRRQEVDRVVAGHEAGHVVGSILVAGLLGWPPMEIVSHIDIHPVPLAASGTSLDATRAMRSQATTYGRMLSRPMQEFLTANGKLELFAEGTLDELTQTCAEMREAGIDLEMWHLAKCIEFVFGPMAEARLTGRSFDEVWDDYSSEADLKDATRYGVLCGMTTEQIVATINQAIAVAEERMAIPQVWAAIRALAAKLKPGRTGGRRASNIVMRAMKQAAPSIRVRPGKSTSGDRGEGDADALIDDRGSHRDDEVSKTEGRAPRIS